VYEAVEESERHPLLDGRGSVTSFRTASVSDRLTRFHGRHPSPYCPGSAPMLFAMVHPAEACVTVTPCRPADMFQ